MWRAAERLGIATEAATPAAEAGLLEFGARVRFRHPLVRSAAYRSASLQERQDVHRALAEVTDPEIDPDRRAWHRAQAAPGPDEDVAEELERSAGRAQARGGLAAAAAFLERAAMLTPEPARRAQRLLAAARAKRDAGALDAALGLLVAVEAGPLDALRTAEVEHLRGQIALEQRRAGDAARLLLSAARRLEPLDADLARETHLEALGAAIWAGDLDSPGGVLAAAEAARAAPPGPEPPRAVDVLLDGVRAAVDGGLRGRRADADPSTRAVSRAGRHRRRSRPLALARRWQSQHHRRPRAVGRRVLACPGRSPGAVRPRDGRARAPAVRAQLSRQDPPPRRRVDHGGAAGRRGSPDRGGDREPAARVRRDDARGLARPGGTGVGADRGHLAGGDRTRLGRSVISHYASSVLDNGLGRHDAARDAAWQAFERDRVGYGPFLVPELAEAASRTGDTALVRAALEWLSERTRVTPTEWALGIEARVRALLSEGDVAERLYRESIDRLGRTRVRVELARAHLLYGEWLRRERRRVDAREQLRTAHDMLDAMGIEAFAERARRELLATGETARKRSVETRDELTAQEALIARLARDGLSNPEIGTRLFISPRTVQYHLRKVFAKLDISSRSQLDRVLPGDPATAGSRRQPCRRAGRGGPVALATGGCERGQPAPS